MTFTLIIVAVFKKNVIEDKNNQSNLRYIKLNSVIKLTTKKGVVT